MTMAKQATKTPDQSTDVPSSPSPISQSSTNTDLANIISTVIQQTLANAPKPQINLSTGTDTGFTAFKGLYDAIKVRANEEPGQARALHALISLMDRSRSSAFNMNLAASYAKETLNLLDEFEDIAADSYVQFTLLLSIASRCAHIEASSSADHNRKSFSSKRFNRNASNQESDNRQFATNDKKKSMDQKTINAMKALGQ